MRIFPFPTSFPLLFFKAQTDDQVSLTLLWNPEELNVDASETLSATASFHLFLLLSLLIQNLRINLLTVLSPSFFPPSTFSVSETKQDRPSVLARSLIGWELPGSEAWVGC